MCENSNKDVTALQYNSKGTKEKGVWQIEIQLYSTAAEPKKCWWGGACLIGEENME